MKDLPLLSLLYNAMPQSRTRRSPYFVATGRQPCLPIDLALSDLKVPAVGNFLDRITSMWRTVKAKLIGQSQRDKTAADHARRSAKIKEGDFVLLSTRYLQLKAISGKMKPRFVGPFCVLCAVDANAFELDLPATMRVHPVFNVSLLRLYHGVYSPPGPIIVEGEVEYEVDRIIRHRGKGKRR